MRRNHDEATIDPSSKIVEDTEVDASKGTDGEASFVRGRVTEELEFPGSKI